MEDRILLIIPQAVKNNAGADLPVGAVSGVFKSRPEVFYQSEDNYTDLKKLLITNSFGVIFLCFLNICDSEAPEVQMIKSLAVKSRLVLYFPDLKFLEIKGVPDSAGGSELAKWHKRGKSIQVNIFRQADLIIVRYGAQKEFLLSLESGLPVTDILNREIMDDYFAKKPAKKLSIIMLTFNQFEDTRNCYESLMKFCPDDYELIIVDNGSKDGTPEYLSNIQSGNKCIKLIFNDINVGFSKANNQGIKISVGDYILLLNNDIILTEGWIQRLIACAESNPEIGVVGPCTNSAVGLQVADADVKNDKKDIERFVAMQLIANAGCWMDVHRIIGFCMLIKREVVEKIGMLDERFGPGGFEDYDFCLRVKQAGYKIMIASDVFIYHLGGRGYSKNNLDYNKLRQQNVEIFIDKWCRKTLEIMETL